LVRQTVNIMLVNSSCWHLPVQALKSVDLMHMVTSMFCFSGNHFQVYNFLNVFSYFTVLELVITFILGLTTNE